MARIRLTKAEINKAFEEALKGPKQTQKLSLKEQLEQLDKTRRLPEAKEIF